MLLLLSLKICSESFFSEKGLELFTIQFHSILVNYILRNQTLSGDNSGILFLIYYVTTHAFIQKKLQNRRTLGDDKLG